MNLNKTVRAGGETGHSSWNDIPDKYWEMAIENLIRNDHTQKEGTS